MPQLRTVVSVLAGLPTVCYLAASTMADTKGANISRMVLKQAGRAKEKVIIRYYISCHINHYSGCNRGFMDQVFREPLIPYMHIPIYQKKRLVLTNRVL